MKKCWIDSKTVIITGATGGIGAGITESLIKKHDCKVIGIIIVEDGLKEFIDSLGDKKGSFSYLIYDVSKRESWISIKNYLEDNKIQADVLINNAGILPPFDRFEHYSEVTLEKCMAVDFYSVAYSIDEMFDPISKSNSPAFITVSSSASLCPLPGTSLYSASKSASKSLTECFALEHKEFYVGCVCPGFTKTNLFVSQTEDMAASKLISSFMSKREKMVKKIVKGIERKKRRMIFGKDAHFMNLIYKFFPRSGPKLISFILKKSNQKIFDKVFKD